MVYTLYIERTSLILVFMEYYWNTWRIKNFLRNSMLYCTLEHCCGTPIMLNNHVVRLLYSVRVIFGKIYIMVIEYFKIIHFFLYVNNLYTMKIIFDKQFC